MKRVRDLAFFALFGVLTTLPLCAEQPKEPPKAEVKKPEPPKKPGRWKEMDYGTFISHAFVHLPSGKYDNNTGNWTGTDVTPRGVAVKLDTDWNAGIIFDTGTMRVSAAWIGGPLNLRGAAFDGSHGPASGLSVPPVYQSTNGPGWASPEGKFDDPRKNDVAPLPPPGPLPYTWAKYKGLYRNGDNVVFSYTVGKANVLEMPGYETKGDVKALVRNIRIENGDVPTIIRLAKEEGKTGTSDGTFAQLGSLNIGFAGAPAGSKLEVDNEGQAFLKLPAAGPVQTFKVFLAAGGEAAKATFAELVKGSAPVIDLSTLTKGGPARWTEEITTKGVLGTGDGPYVTDTITIPEENPWKSWMRIGGFDFFADGKRAALSTWSGDVWIVSGIDDKLENLKWKRFATGIHHPLGLKIVNDEIYTVGNSQITHLKDLNGDGEADFYECFCNDWETTSAFHAFCFDLQTDPEGNFVFAMGCPVRGGGRSFHRIAENHGTIMKVDRYGTKAWTYATGFRAPNGIGVSPTGQVTSGDNEGTFVPACPINWVNEGSFNGVVDSAHFNKEKLNIKTTATVAEGTVVLDQGDAPKPLCRLPMSVDNSGGDQCWVTSDKWGPFTGDMLHLSYGKSSLFKVMYETVNGQIQGGAVKIPTQLTSSAMRSRFNPVDGQLYVSGLKGWQTNAGRDGGLNRIRYTGKPVNMPKELHIKTTGAQIVFTCALDKASVEDLTNYNVEMWNYHWTQSYGSPEFSVLNPANKGHDTMKVTAAKLDADGKTLFLTIENIQPVNQMKIKMKLKTADGTPVDTEIYNTIYNLGK